MRAVQINGFGGPDVLGVGEAPVPAVGPGQVRIRVAAAGVNPVDWKVREGYLAGAMPFVFPHIIGNEVAGTIDAVGDGVTDFAVGDAVYCATGMTGAFADMVSISADQVARKPANLTMVEAASLPVAVVTSHVALEAGEVGAGSRILIHAAAGGVGSIALQMAKLRGATVTALGSAANLDFLRGLGADAVVDRSTKYEDSLSGFDVVLDAFGPEAEARSWGLLRPGGILVSLAAPPDEAAAASHGVRATMVFGGPNGPALAAATAAVERGEIRPVVARTYPVEEAKAALAEVQGGHVRGKLVLTFD